MKRCWLPWIFVVAIGLSWLYAKLTKNLDLMEIVFWVGIVGVAMLFAYLCSLLIRKLEDE